MLEFVERAFAPELLRVSPYANDLVDFLWTVYNMGGNISTHVLFEQFPLANDYITPLSKAGLVRYALGGFMNKNLKKESIIVSIDGDFEKVAAGQTNRKDFEDLVFRNYGEKLIPHCRSVLTEPLAIMLTSVIYYATPSTPVFVNKVVRRAARMSMKSQIQCRDWLDYYLHRFLGLVAFETVSMVNLSVRSKQRIMNYQKVWELYSTEHKDKIKDEPKADEPKKLSSIVTSEQERKLKSYFPWMKL